MELICIPSPWIINTTSVCVGIVCVCVCVYVCECVCVYVYVFVFVCVCVSLNCSTKESFYTFISREKNVEYYIDTEDKDKHKLNHHHTDFYLQQVLQYTLIVSGLLLVG